MKLPLCFALALASAFLARAAEVAPASTTSPAPLVAGGVTVETGNFGTMPDGTAVKIYSLHNPGGITVKVTEYGAAITAIEAPDHDGQLADVVLGFDTLAPYLTTPNYFGAIVGRVGNRIANGRFSLDGKDYTLAKNSGQHTLHGGVNGFNKKVWASAIVPATTTAAAAKAVQFTLVSPDGDEGFPGQLTVNVTYSVTTANELFIQYQATTDAATPINLTNHSYFNLAGQGTVLNQVLWINADNYTPTDAGLIPTGEIKSVKGTPFDFTTPTAIGAHLREAGSGGYDNNFVLNTRSPLPAAVARASGSPRGLELAARVSDPASGRVLEVFTTQPDVQLYTASNLNGRTTFAGDVAYPRFGAVCLETQHVPDSINHSEFPTTVLRPGETYQQTTVYKFSFTTPTASPAVPANPAAPVLKPAMEPNAPAK